MHLRIIVLLITICFSASSLAATVSISVPSLNGVYTQSSSSVFADFDLGVQFNTVTSMSIDWAATTTTGSYRWCDASVGTCSISSFEQKDPMAVITNHDPVYGSTLGGGSLDLAATTNNLTALLGLAHNGFPLGTGRLSLRLEDDANGYILTDATIEISDLKLTVEGTVVPLPAALPLLMSGLTGLLFFQRKRKLA